MGRRNREKRAAKKRSRQRRGPTPPQGGFGGGLHDLGCTCGGPEDGYGFDDPDASWSATPPPPPAELVAEALLAAAHADAGGDTAAAVSCAAELVGGYFAGEERLLSTAANLALAEVITRVWHAGWLPVDVWEITQRRTDAAAGRLLVDTVAADFVRYATATVHERWAAQVGQLDATLWWDRDRPHLGQWVERNGVSFHDGLLTTITLLAALVALPELPQLVPPPGTATRRGTASAAGVDQRILGRVRGLLAKAESTEYPEEAEALSAKAQELMNRHAFERALVDAEDHKQQSATSTRLWLDNPYLQAKSHLVAAIADANRCKSVFYPKLGFVALVGEQMDLEITEVLATSLLVQATRAVVAEGRHVGHAGTSRTRSFRQSFLVSYAVRIGERLAEAGARAHDPVDDARLLPVLADRSRVVEETFREMFSHTVEKAVSVTNGAGWHAGRAAADRADLTIERQAVSA